jgi:hypothetical protein
VDSARPEYCNGCSDYLPSFFAVIHIVVENSVDWTAIVGVAGTLAGAWFQDRRRCAQEAKLRSGDDLLVLIDDVALKLEDLAEPAAVMQSMVFTFGADEEHTGPASRANAAYQQTERPLHGSACARTLPLS